MKKTILILSMLTLIAATSMAGSTMLPEIEPHVKRDKGYPKPNPLPSVQEAIRCSYVIETLVRDIESYTKIHGLNAARNSLGVGEEKITLLRAVPAEYFFWGALKYMRSSYLHGGMGINDGIDHSSADIVIFLGLAKLDLGLEDFNLQQLAGKYLFPKYQVQVRDPMSGELIENDCLTPAELVDLATRFGITNFGRHFPETQASTPDSAPSPTT